MQDLSTKPDLLAAIEAAKAEAATRPLCASELGGRQDSPDEPWWYFPPSPVLHRETARLLAAHDLSILFLGETMGAHRQLETRWLVRHKPSGQAHEFSWHTAPMPDKATPTHGIAAAIQHTAGFFPRVLLSIPVRRARPGETVVDGVIVGAPTPTTTPDRVENGVVVCSPAPPPVPSPEEQRQLAAMGSPGWMGLDDAGAGGGLPDPGLLGGESTDEEAERTTLDAEADAVVLGPAEVVDNAALWEAVKDWGAATGTPAQGLYQAALLAAHGGDAKAARQLLPGSPAALEQRARLVAWLQEGGFLP